MDTRASGSDDETDEGLFGEFESACTAVSHLFRNHCWKNFQSAAVHTTQLYKHGIEAKKRAYERGQQAGRLQLAKEILSLKRYSNNNKLDVQDLYSILAKYALLPPDHLHHHHHHHHQLNSRQRSMNIGGTAAESSQAVHLFQQALNITGSPTSHSSARSTQPELNTFLTSQVHRHRKRAHSPMESSGGSPPNVTAYVHHTTSGTATDYFKRRRM